ncbi:MAG: pimeloyl-ACP methyl ester carboxylesterase [Polyangiales bacterium]|jgi:pimeloyl-ACP methyl ester carboxylesterase
MIHGLGENASSDFEGVADRLAQSFYVLALDLPGFGASAAAEHSFHPSDYADDIARFMSREFEGRPVFLLGHSMGGAIAALIAGRHPELVSRLALVDVAGVLHREAWAASQFIDPLRAQGGTAMPVGMMETFLSIGRSVEPDPEMIVSQPRMRSLILGNDPGKIAALSLIITDVGPALSAIEAPTLLLWGERDRVAPMRTAHALEGRLRTPLNVLEGVAHVPMSDAPERFVAAVSAHFAGAPPTPAQSLETHGDFACDGEAGVELEGEYGRVELRGCEGVQIRNARIRELLIHDSNVTMENVDIVAGDGTGVLLEGGVLRATGGSIRGQVALSVSDGRLDFAGVTISATSQAFLVDEPTRALFSACVIQSGEGAPVHAHGDIVIAAE